MDRMPPPPLIALRSFEAAARRSSFLAAADELGVTPAAVSHQVKRLEQHLGVRLFHRSHRAVTLTPAGAGLAESLRDVFDRLNAALARTMGEGGTRIEVSALPSLAAKWLAPPSARSSRSTEVTTTCARPILATASARCSGSSGSTAPGMPVRTLQKAQARVQVSPMIRKVACFFSQHSPMLGQPASSHTVCRALSRTIARVAA